MQWHEAMRSTCFLQVGLVCRVSTWLPIVCMSTWSMSFRCGGLERVLPVCLCYLWLSPRPAAKSLRLLKLSDSLSASAGAAPVSAMTLHIKSFPDRPFLNLPLHGVVPWCPSHLKKKKNFPHPRQCFFFFICHKVAPPFSALHPTVTAFTVHIIGCHLAKMCFSLRPFSVYKNRSSLQLCSLYNCEYNCVPF